MRRVDARAEVERASIILSGSEAAEDMVVVHLGVATVTESMFTKRFLRGLFVSSLRSMDDGVRRTIVLDQYYYF